MNDEKWSNPLLKNLNRILGFILSISTKHPWKDNHDKTKIKTRIAHDVPWIRSPSLGRCGEMSHLPDIHFCIKNGGRRQSIFRSGLYFLIIIYNLGLSLQSRMIEGQFNNHTSNLPKQWINPDCWATGWLSYLRTIQTFANFRPILIRIKYEIPLREFFQE